MEIKSAKSSDPIRTARSAAQHCLLTYAGAETKVFETPILHTVILSSAGRVFVSNELRRHLKALARCRVIPLTVASQTTAQDPVLPFQCPSKQLQRKRGSKVCPQL